MLAHIRNFFSNPISFSLLLFLIAIGCFSVAGANIFVDIVNSVINGLGGSLVVASVFAIIYEYLSIEGIVSNAVSHAVGQSRSSSLGITDIVDEVGSIDHKNILKNSQVLRISSRYSAVLLHGLRTEIYKRLRAGKSLHFLRMKNSDNVPHGRGPEGTPDRFFQTLSPGDPGLLKFVELYEVDKLFCYNFVESDSGIWIKLYLNAGTPEAPPAFFVEKGSLLYKTYKRDIDCLFELAERIDLNDETQ